MSQDLTQRARGGPTWPKGDVSGSQTDPIHSTHSDPVILTFRLLPPSVGFHSSFTVVKSALALTWLLNPAPAQSAPGCSLLPVFAVWVSCLPMILLSSSAVSYLPIQLACYELNCVPLVRMLKSLLPVPQQDGM